MAKRIHPGKHLLKLKPTKPPPSPSGGFTQRKVGSGITERSETTFSGPLNDEGLALFKKAMENVTRITVHDIEEMLRAFLRGAGFSADPTEDGKYPFRSHVTPELEEGGAYHSGTWYAAKVLDLLSSARWYASLGETDRAIDCAFDGARLYQEGINKHLFEDDVLMGKGFRGVQHGKGKKRGEQQRAAREKEWEKWQAAAEEVWKKQPSWGKEAVALMIHPRFPNESVRTIRNRIIKPIL